MQSHTNEISHMLSSVACWIATDDVTHVRLDRFCRAVRQFLAREKDQSFSKANDQTFITSSCILVQYYAIICHFTIEFFWTGNGSIMFSECLLAALVLPGIYPYVKCSVSLARSLMQYTIKELDNARCFHNSVRLKLKTKQWMAKSCICTLYV